MIRKLLCKFGFHSWKDWKETGFTSDQEIHWSATCNDCRKYETTWHKEWRSPVGKLNNGKNK